MLEDSIEVPWSTIENDTVEDSDDGTYWMAYYFYSSGTEKDTSPIKIHLLPNGIIQVCDISFVKCVPIYDKSACISVLSNICFFNAT